MQLAFVGEEELSTCDVSQLATRFQRRPNHVRHAQQPKRNPRQHSRGRGKAGAIRRYKHKY